MEALYFIRFQGQEFRMSDGLGVEFEGDATRDMPGLFR